MFESVAAVIRTRFASVVYLPTQFDNGPLVNQDDLWVRHTIRWGAINRLEIGDDSPDRLVGVMIAQLRQPFLLGDQALLTLADTIADAFRNVTYSGVTFRTPTVESFGRDGAYWLVNVQCPFFSDEVA